MFDVLESPVDARPDLPLSELPPSGWTAVELGELAGDPAAASDRELIEQIVAWERVASWAAARQARLLAELARRRPADSSPDAPRSPGGTVLSEFAADEVGLALRLARGVAADRLTLARTLVRVLPETLAAWEAGQLTAYKASIIAEATYGLPDDAARAVQDRVLPRAHRQTPGLLRRSVRRALLTVDPDGADRRHRAARRDRRVVHQPEPDGMGSLWALLPAEDAVAAWSRLSTLARGLGADDPRTLDARRADLLADLLTGRGCAATGTCRCNPAPGPATGPATAPTRRADATPDRGADVDATRDQGADSGPGANADRAASSGPGADADRAASSGPGASAARACGAAAPKPLVQVTVALTTLLGLDDAPGELAGHGPVPAAVARALAADGAWRRLVTDPLTGTVLDSGRRAYTPGAALADLVRARDATCRWPTCTAPAAGADLDHTIPFDHTAPDRGGPTAPENLAALCRHHHRLKTLAPGWRVRQDPDGTLTWTTPTGHTHTSHPHDHRPDPPRDCLPVPSAARNEPPQSEPPQSEPPQAAPPQAEPPQAEPPQAGPVDDEPPF